MIDETFDVVVIGGGPAGATAATDLARRGRRVALLDRAGRIKPCGGAIPPRAISDFDIPDHLLVGKATAARIIAPSNKSVDMPVGEGFVGMVDRDRFDEWLRARAALAGAHRRTGRFERIERTGSDDLTIVYRAPGEQLEQRIGARLVIGADGANSAVARQELPAERIPSVSAYHEVIVTPANEDFDRARCDVFYQGQLSADFYGWIFPHGDTVSVGVGSAVKGYAPREAVADLRRAAGLNQCTTVRREGAPIPLRPRKRWDNGRDTIVIGDAAGVVAPASGEGIYYAMASARHAAEAAHGYLSTGRTRALRGARRAFMREHGRTFWVLGVLQYWWYSSDRRRERFVAMCADPDVQSLTWQAYMNKRLVRARPWAHTRIFMKDMRHLLGSFG